MPRGRPSSLAGMSIDALLTLRDDVGRVLSQKTSELREQLQRLDFEAARPSTARTARVGSLRGRKISPKYRDPDNRANVWAGRGAVPRWMQEKIRAGAKRDDFLIGASGPSSRTKRTKKTARKAAKRKTSSKKAKTKTVSKKQQVSGKRKPARATTRKRPAAATLPQSATTVSPTGSATE
jgi:DNA-binding protein H-NS